MGPAPIQNTFSRPKIFECDDGNRYVIKFHGQPFQSKMAANEFLGFQLAKILDLPVPTGVLLTVPNTIIPAGQQHQGTLHFGSLFDPEANPASLVDFASLANNHNCYPGVIAFDHWILNDDRYGNRGNLLIAKGSDSKYNIIIIDHGNAFSGPDWNPTTISNFLDISPLPINQTAAINYQPMLRRIASLDDFLPLFDKIEAIAEDEIDQCMTEIPIDWVNVVERNAIKDFLLQRKNKVRPALLSHNDLLFYFRGGHPWIF